MVSLTPEFRKIIEENIHEIVLSIPALKQEYPKLKQEWKFEHDFDFIYGNVIGQILGGILSAFRMLYKRETTNEEILMIGEIVESYFPLIRETISTS